MPQARQMQQVPYTLEGVILRRRAYRLRKVLQQFLAQCMRLDVAALMCLCEQQRLPRVELGAYAVPLQFH